MNTDTRRPLTTDPTAPTERPVAAWKAALAGIVAAGSALAAGEFVAALAAPRPGPVTAVANRVIDEAPDWFVDFGKDVFGFSDKTALVIGTIVITLVIGAALGIASRRSRWIGAAGIAVFGIVGFFAMASDAQSGPIAAFLFASISVLTGIAVLNLLFAAMRGPVMAGLVERYQLESQLESGETVARQAPTSSAPVSAAVSRRTFVGWSAAIGALATLGGFAARSLQQRSVASAARANVELVTPPGADEVAASVSVAEQHPVAGTAGITPVVMPNDQFYRIDTAILVPQIDPADWEMRVTGMVGKELTLTYDDLLERATSIAPVTLSCVSNEVGGELVGNAVWQGVALTELLDEAGVEPGATQISSRSVDGWDCGFPTDLAYDGRTAMVAVAMNGEPLPIEHGFPARLVVSGLYGYVSATKWLDKIELTTLEAFNGYWIPRGWAKFGPVKTQSRIDIPRHRTDLASTEAIPIAGVAWAPNTGITKVEVQIDDGPWTEAALGEELGINSWRQWRLMWEPTPGEHVIRCRATDRTGATQTEVRTPVAPDGASGWHTIAVRA